jgi:hypothetical protein
MIQSILNLFKPTPNWKKVIELHYHNNVLTVTTFDMNNKQYYHAINEDSSPYQWRRYPSKTLIKDYSIIEELDKQYLQVLTGKKIRGGWVKSL